jgi:hypothetical protein
MGDDFNRLSPLLKLAHTGTKRLEGRVSVKRGGKVANIMCKVFRFPAENPETHLIVECSHFSDRMEWVRYFDGFKMSSNFIMDSHYLVERLGPLAMNFKAMVNDGKLEYQFGRTKLFGIPLPSILSPKIIAYEQEIDGKYQFFVSVNMLIVGFVLSYGGDLKISETLNNI